MAVLEVEREIKSVGLSLAYYDKQFQRNAKFLQNHGEKLKEKYRHPIEVENQFYATKINELEREGRKLFKEWDLWTEWLQHVKGVGVGLTLRIFGFLDFEKAKHISSFWKFCGFVSSGKQDFNHTVKGYLIRQGMAFLGLRSIKPYCYSEKFTPRLDGKYAQFFLRFRRQADERYPD